MDLAPVIDKHKVLLLDVLRVYTGVFLFAKGAVFIGDTAALVGTMNAASVPAASVVLAHYVALAHLAGGLMLVFGLATRLAAAVQIPIVLGAALFVHRREGFFAPNQSLDLALLVLVVLAILVVAGGGPASLDAYVARRTPPPEVVPAV